MPNRKEIPMYDQPKLSEPIRFAGVDAGSAVIDVCRLERSLSATNLHSQTIKGI
jgi:hypothetical protein